MWLLLNLSNGSKLDNKTTIGAVAIIDLVDKITEATATIARTSTRTPVSPGTTSPEMVYYKMMNHAQEECRKRINDKQPCVNNKGQMYWPRINNTTESPNTVQQNSSPMVESIFEPTVFH